MSVFHSVPHTRLMIEVPFFVMLSNTGFLKMYSSAVLGMQFRYKSISSKSMGQAGNKW